MIDKTLDNSWLRDDSKKHSKLLSVSFVFNDGTIKINHPWLAEEFVKHFKSHYDDLAYKSWKLDLERYSDRFHDNLKKQEFKYRLAKSFYNLFTKGGFFNVTESEPTPNKLMLCIATLLEFCLIPVGDPDEVEDVKIRHVRNWITRKDFEPALTHLEVPVNKDRLLKYFEPEFINLADDIKGADVLSIAFYIAKRFNINHLLPDLAHIAKALKEGIWLIGHQIIKDTSGPFEPQFEEFTTFSKFVNGIRNKKKIASIKYMLDGDEKEYELSQRLPMFLIEEAIKDYSEDHQVEFDMDPVKTTLIKSKDGGIKVDKETQFNQPETRFMVRFVKSFYDYLLAEAPPEKREYMPSKRYYAIIANILQKTFFFSHQHNPEWFIIAKVEQWHKLAGIK